MNMKFGIHIYFFTLILIFYCKEENKKTTKELNNSKTIIAQKHKTKTLIINEGYKNYKSNDSSDFRAQFRASNGNVYISLTLSKELPFQKQIDEFKIILSKANKEFNLDSLKSISMNLNRYSGDLILDISSIPEIQEYIKYCDDNDIPVLHYKIVSKEVLKSKLIQLLLKCLDDYDLNIVYASIQKCRSYDQKILKNLSIKPKSKTMKVMLCGSLYIRMNRN